MLEVITKDTSIDQQSAATGIAMEKDQPLLVHHAFTVEDLERFQPNRRNYRVEFTTRTLEAWCNYCKQEAAGGNAIAFIHGESGFAQAIFDLGTVQAPGHGQWHATLRLQKTPEFEALLYIADLKCGQRDLCEWVEEWASALSFLNAAGEPMDPSQSLSALRTITIQAKLDSESTVAGFSEAKSTMESVEAKGRNAALPAFLVMKTAPHNEFAEREFICRISMLTSSSDPKFILKPQRLNKQLDEIADEFVAMVKDRTDGSDLRLEIGTVSY